MKPAPINFEENENNLLVKLATINRNTHPEDEVEEEKRVLDTRRDERKVLRQESRALCVDGQAAGGRPASRTDQWLRPMITGADTVARDGMVLVLRVVTMTPVLLDYAIADYVWLVTRVNADQH